LTASRDRRDERYKEPSIISDTGAAMCSNANFGPAGHYHPPSSPLPLVCTVPSASAILIASWKPCSVSWNFIVGVPNAKSPILCIPCAYRP
jgi:hypothetical protein